MVSWAVLVVLFGIVSKLIAAEPRSVILLPLAAIGKIVAAWLPIFIFFAQGFEHLVVNFFLIPAGMMMGAKVSIVDWIIWNAIPRHCRQYCRRISVHRGGDLLDVSSCEKPCRHAVYDSARPCGMIRGRGASSLAVSRVAQPAVFHSQRYSNPAQD